jgi:DNA (cytosine-5)-methyltransferase 1
MTFGSLFTGIGGLDLALEELGHECAWQVECDPYANAVLERHWPTVRRYLDVRDVNASNATRVDLVCGGFPCQPHSLAGKRRGTSDARWLWPEFSRIIEELRPGAVFIENVPGLRTSGLRDVLADLVRLGFDAEWLTVGACAVGAPHSRQRLFLLAYSSGFGLQARSREANEKRRRPEVRLGAIGSDLQSEMRWIPPSDVPRVDHGFPRQVDRIRLTGNAVVPAQAAFAWQSLVARASGVTP